MMMIHRPRSANIPNELLRMEWNMNEKRKSKRDGWRKLVRMNTRRHQHFVVSIVYAFVNLEPAQHSHSVKQTDYTLISFCIFQSVLVFMVKRSHTQIRMFRWNSFDLKNKNQHNDFHLRRMRFLHFASATKSHIELRALFQSNYHQ